MHNLALGTRIKALWVPGLGDSRFKPLIWPKGTTEPQWGWMVCGDKNHQDTSKSAGMDEWEQGAEQGVLLLLTAQPSDTQLVDEMLMVPSPSSFHLDKLPWNSWKGFSAILETQTARMKK